MTIKTICRAAKIQWLAAAFLVLVAPHAYCWGPLGHETVALMAEADLDPATQDAITQIIGPGIGLDQISNCADDMRYGDTGCAGLFDPPLSMDKLTAPWHYINIPLEANVSRTPTTAELDQYQDCGQTAQGPTAEMLADSMRDCLNAQIQFAVSELRVQSPPSAAFDAQPSASSQADAALVLRRKRAALMFLVHLAADAHQPMHVMNDHDSGGNAEKVIFQHRQQNLHEVWDDVIGAQRTTDAKTLAKLLQEDLKNIPQDEVASWTQDDIEAIVNNAIGESFDVGKNTIYPNYFAAKAKNPGKKAVPLDADYQSQMQPIAYRRLQQAAVRLAFLLNQALGQNQSSNSPQTQNPVSDNGRKHGRLRLKSPPNLQDATWDGRTPVIANPDSDGKS